MAYWLFPLSVAVALGVGWWAQSYFDRRDRRNGLIRHEAAEGVDRVIEESRPSRRGLENSHEDETGAGSKRSAPDEDSASGDPTREVIA